MKEPIRINEPVLIVEQAQWDAHTTLRERAEMKLAQLEDEKRLYDLAGIRSELDGDDAERRAYIRLLKWLLGRGL